MIAASLVLCALLAGIAGTTWGLFEAKRQARPTARRSRYGGNGEEQKRAEREAVGQTRCRGEAVRGRAAEELR